MDAIEDRLVKAEREKATAIRAIIHNIMDRYPVTRTDKWMLLFHFANYCNVRIPWNTLDGLRSLPNPEALIKPWVESLCPPEGIVLDPFLGSGTTMKVARDLHRSCIGIELSKTYADYAEARCGLNAIAALNGD